MKKLLAVVVLALFTTGVNAGVWIIDATPQNGTPGALGFGDNLLGDGMTAATSPTLGFVGWFTIGVNGGGNQSIYGTGTAPVSPNEYNCYGLTVLQGANANCTAQGATKFWNPTSAMFSGSLNDDTSFMDLSWTGTVGTEVPFPPSSALFFSGVNSGTYDENGLISGGNNTGTGMPTNNAQGTPMEGFVCWNNPLAGLPGPPNFCGNLSGVTTTIGASSQSKFNRELPDGFTFFTDNGDGTITIDMSDSTYANCVANTLCTPGSNSSDVFAQWRVNAVLVPIPAAVWLFGSALGLLGWLRRRASV